MKTTVRMKIVAVTRRNGNNGGEVSLALTPTSMSSHDQYIFPDGLTVEVPQVARPDVKKSAADLLGRYVDVRVDLVGDDGK